jgi:lambda repressor-like predicted transcriptional regulator
VNKQKKRKECCNWKQIQDRILDDIFDIAADVHGWTINEFSERSGLAWSTIENLRANITRFPQFRTVVLLARAVGMDVSVITKEYKKARAA